MTAKPKQSNLPILVVLTYTIITLGCEPQATIKESTVFPYMNRGFYMVNEGNYTWGNGSLMFFSYDSMKSYNGIFEELAQKPVGDIPLRTVIHSNSLYIIVNNSGKIEILDLDIPEYSSSFEGLVSPRDIAFIDEQYAIVSSLYSDSLTILDLNNNSIYDYIDIGRPSECILVVDDRVFISNWSDGNSVTVLGKSDLEILKVIEVPKEPSEMVVDKSGNLRVICSGGYLNEEYPAIITIDPNLLEVTSTLLFKSKYGNPSELVINASLDTLYYLNNDIFCLSYTDVLIPETPMIEAGGRNFYRLGYYSEAQKLVVTDAVDYVQKGYIYIYSSSGSEIGKFNAGIIPGKINIE